MAKILVCVAWPYASGPRHLGHAVSTFIPADIFARYHRMKGDEVLMVGGSDMHGTPVTVRADQEKVPKNVIAERYHALHEKNIEQLGVRYDLYWNTADPHHEAWVQEIFLALRDKGHVYEATMVSPFCTTDQRFLPDRYVEGTCPHCGFPRARGDQCENCGRILDPFELKDPRCNIHGTTPIPKETKHFFFRLSAFEKPLTKWAAKDKEHWRHHVLTFMRSWLREGLKDRPITRDLEWGIEVPVPGYETKRIYVWFEAVMGYLTATREWYRRHGKPDGWKDFWYDPKARHYYFIGKDNIVFHTIFWPAILLGYDEKLDLPYDVPATQFLNISGERMSAGRGRGVWLPDLLERFDPDQIRYYGIATMPETKDTDFEWEDFAHKAPWELIKRDRAACGTVLHVALRVSRSLAILMAPFLPFSSSRLWRSLGYESDVHSETWDQALEDVPSGQTLRVGKPLFTKIDLSEAKENSADRFDLRVAQIVDVTEHPNADNLYVLEVDIGGERRQIVAGIRKDYSKDQLRGRKIVVLVNLEPAKLRGIESRGMLFAAEDKAEVGLVLPPDAAPVGAQVLGVRGAPVLPFSEFQKYKLQVGPDGTILFLGREGETRIRLAVDGTPLKVDKGMKEGTWVH